VRRNKPITTKKFDSQPPTPIEMSEKNFEQACQSNRTIEAQQYLLAWAKKQWPNASLNLTTLREHINDEPFKLALMELEHALYAKNLVAWNGQSLLTAFKRIKKSYENVEPMAVNIKELLPPLYPSHSE
jgi:phage terminase small subunit